MAIARGEDPACIHFGRGFSVQPHLDRLRKKDLDSAPSVFYSGA